MAMVTASGELYCYHFDSIGNTMAITDNNQNMVNRYVYTPFGIIANQTETVPQPFKFVGKWGVMTEPNGFYYMKARYYDPEVGRFISEDPLGFEGGDVNLYAYVRNLPTMFIDPLGLDWIYEQSTGQLSHQPAASLGGGPPAPIAVGYSGHGPGLNNPSMQAVPNVGPIPQGTWTIGPQQDNRTASGRNLSASMRLTPEPGVTSRAGFLIHGDNTRGDQSASEGCIILNRSTRDLIGR